MAWTTPKTWVANQVLTAAELNEQLRDNLAETMNALATVDGQMFFTQYENRIAGRSPQSKAIDRASELKEGTTSTSYTDLDTVGPQITVDTGAAALVFQSAVFENDTANAASYMSFAVTGDTTISADDSRAIIIDGLPVGNGLLTGTLNLVDLTPGENVFTAKYKAGSGRARFYRRIMTVFPL